MVSLVVLYIRFLIMYELEEVIHAGMLLEPIIYISETQPTRSLTLTLVYVAALLV